MRGSAGWTGPRGTGVARHPCVSAGCALVSDQFGSGHSVSPVVCIVGGTRYLTIQQTLLIIPLRTGVLIQRAKNSHHRKTGRLAQ